MAAAAAEDASPRPHGVVWATRSRKNQETPWPCLLTNPGRPKSSGEYECTWAGDRSPGAVADWAINGFFDGAPADLDALALPGMDLALKDAEAWSSLRVGATVELEFDDGATATGEVLSHDQAGAWKIRLEATATEWDLQPSLHPFRVLDSGAQSDEDEDRESGEIMWTEDEDRLLAAIMAEKQAHVSWSTIRACLANDRSVRQIQDRWDAISAESAPSEQDRQDARDQLASLVNKRTTSMLSMLSPPATPSDGPEDKKSKRKGDHSKPAPKLFVKEDGKDSYQSWEDESKSSRGGRQTRLLKEFRTLVEKQKSKSPSPSPSEGDSDEEQEEKIDFDDGPGATLIEHTFRNGLELAEARADTDFAQFGPWVGRRATLSANQEGEEEEAADGKERGPATVIGWKPGAKGAEASWKLKTDGGAAVDSTLTELTAALATAEAEGILSFGERSGMQKAEDLDDICNEIDELLECALDRVHGNQVVWAKVNNMPWWPAELVAPQEVRAACLLAPRLIEEWEEDHVLVRYFGSNERIGWVLATKCLGFDEANSVACMPSKSNKRRLAVLKSMEQATERKEKLSSAKGTVTEKSESARKTRGSAAAAEESDAGSRGGRRRAAQKPARFREEPKKPGGSGLKRAKVSGGASSKGPKVPSKQGARPRSVSQDAARTSTQRLTPLEAHVARQTLATELPDVWVEYSVEAKERIVEQVNEALLDASQQPIYTLSKLNKYIQNLRYKTQSAAGDKRSQSDSSGRPAAKRRTMPNALGTAPHDERTLLTATFEGTGPLQMEFDESMLVIRVDEGGMAWQAGVRNNMQLVTFQGVNLAELNFEQIMNHIRSTSRPWTLAFADQPSSRNAQQLPRQPEQEEIPHYSAPNSAKMNLTELCAQFYRHYGNRKAPMLPKDIVDRLQARPRHMYDLLAMLESVGAIAPTQDRGYGARDSSGRKALVHLGREGMSTVLENLSHREEPVSPLSEKGGRSWRFISTGLQHAGAAILHILLRNGGGPILSSSVTFYMWEMIEDTRSEQTSLSQADAQRRADAATFESLGIGYFASTFADNAVRPDMLLNKLDDPNDKEALVKYLNGTLNIALPDCQWVCDQIRTRRATTDLAAVASGGAGQGAGGAAEQSGLLLVAAVQNADHKQATELDRLHRQLREVYDLLACPQLGVCVHVPSSSLSGDLQLASCAPGLPEAGQRLNERCGVEETVLQLNTAAFPVSAMPTRVNHAVHTAQAGAAEHVTQQLPAPDPQFEQPVAPAAAPANIYYSGQIVQCHRCSLRFRSPQECHSLVCPDCVLPIEDENVEAFLAANRQMTELKKEEQPAQRLLAELKKEEQAQPAQQQPDQQGGTGAAQPAAAAAAPAPAAAADPLAAAAALAAAALPAVQPAAEQPAVQQPAATDSTAQQAAAAPAAEGGASAEQPAASPPAAAQAEQA